MAYEKLRLVTASVSGDIYLSKTKDGLMDVNSRRVITDEAIQAVTDWFYVNKRKTVNLKALMEKSIAYFIHLIKKKRKNSGYFRGGTTMKNYDPNIRWGIHTVKVSFQQWDYKGYVTFVKVVTAKV